MNRNLWKWLAAIAALVALVPAHAQMRHRGMHEARGGGERGSAQQQLAPSSEALPRQDPAQSAQPGRMSPEERRQLRRDIHQAGRELSRPDPQRPQP